MKVDNIRIHLTIAIFIFCVSWVAATGIPDEDDNNSNKSIAEDYETTLLLDEDEDDDDDDEDVSSTASPIKPDTKMFNAGVIKRTETELTCRKTFEYDGQTLSHCYDDSHCKLYGDCCRDSKFYDEPEQTVAIVAGSVYNNSRYGCYGTGGVDAMHASMIGRCPQTASLNRETRDKCERRDEDFISVYPVSSGDGGGHVYKNVWCAWCHGERWRVVYWKPQFQCNGRDGRVVTSVRLEDASDHTLLYRDGRWYYADYGNRTLLSCDFRIRPPAVNVTHPLRPCVGEGSAEIVDGCPGGTPTAVALACASHTYTLFEYRPSGGRSMRVFRNADCARCNGLTTNQLTCEPPPPPLRMPPYAFGSLFSVNVAGERRDPCAADEIYDVPAVKCRNVIRDELPGACLTFVTFDQGEYDKRTVDNKSAYVYAYKKRVLYRTGDRPTATVGGSKVLQVCTENADGLLRPYKQSAYAVYLSYAGVVGSCVSVAALVAHLALFGCGGCRAAAEPKNLPEKNLASLSAGLLLGYVSYLLVALRVVSPGRGLPCLVSALTTQFGFLAAFAWMFVMSADVWIVLHASTKKLRVTGGQRHGRFVVYSLFAWLVPATLTALSATIELQLATGALLSELRPNFRYDCWFRNPQSLVALFVLPVGTAIAANYVSFLGAVRLIATSDDGFKSSGSCSNATAVNRTRRNLKIYVRLSLMMGLAWVFALVGAVTDSDVAWTLNTALNSLQGAFIFVAFDCNHITVQKLAVFRKQPPVSETQTTTAATPLSGST